MSNNPQLILQVQWNINRRHRYKWASDDDVMIAVAVLHVSGTFRVHVRARWDSTRRVKWKEGNWEEKAAQPLFRQGMRATEDRKMDVPESEVSQRWTRQSQCGVRGATFIQQLLRKTMKKESEEKLGDTKLCRKQSDTSSILTTLQEINFGYL